jgi:endonuclease YncB( thermonuclease family)
MAIFATGVAVGTALPSAWSARPITPSAAASPGIGASGAADTGLPRYPVDVTRVIDGDTFEGRVRAWPGIDIITKVRLRDIDAPEMRGRCEQEFAQAQAARTALGDLLNGGAVSITRVSLDKYGGRVLADASAGRTADVAAALREAGLVRRYSGGRRDPWC